MISVLAGMAAIVLLAGIAPSSPYSWKLIPGDGPPAPLAGIARSFGLSSLSLTAAGILGIVVMALAPWRIEVMPREVRAVAAFDRTAKADLSSEEATDIFGRSSVHAMDFR